MDKVDQLIWSFHIYSGPIWIWLQYSDLNVGMMEALKLNQPVLVALFITRRLGEATASEKARAIRTAHAQLKELKAIGGKGGTVELATQIIPPQTTVLSGELHQGQPPSHHHASGGFGGGIFSSGAGDFGYDLPLLVGDWMPGDFPEVDEKFPGQ